MARAGAHPGRGAIPIALALVGGGLLPSAVAATGEQTVVLPGTTTTAVTADLDGDGAREIIRLVQVGSSSGHAVDAWSLDGTTWSTLGQTPLPDSRQEPSTGQVGGYPVALLAATVEGRDRVLAFTAELVPDDPNGATCCLTVFDVRIAASGSLDLQRLQNIDSGAQSFMTADVDGDGTDELVLHESLYASDPDEQAATITVSRWTGSGFEATFQDSDERWLFGFTLAETDGVAGDDLLFAPTAEGSLQRLAWRDGALQAEEAHIDMGSPDEGWVAGATDGTIILSLVDEARAYRWPRGEDPVMVKALPTLSYPGLMLLGDGPDALVALQDGITLDRGESPTLLLHDLELRELGEVGVNPATEEFWRIVNGRAGSAWRGMPVNIWPYTGPLNGVQIDGRPSSAASGMLIQPGGRDGFTARPMASLIGIAPIGTAGPHDAWAVLGDMYSGPPGSAYLSWGGMSFGSGRVSVTPVDQLLLPDDEVVQAAFDLRDAVEVTSDVRSGELLADGEGFSIAVTAPAGSRVLVADGTDLQDHEVVSDPLVVEFLPRPTRLNDENQELEAMIAVVMPDGRGITRRWTGTFVREPPEIILAATTDAMALSATLEGRATPRSIVTADGRAVQTDANGRFVATVDAPIWPAHLVVTARDPLGNEATELVEVVGLVDYRGLPWAAIMVVATILVGGVLYVRTPKRRVARPMPDGDGRLEELELDAIDGIEPGSR